MARSDRCRSASRSASRSGKHKDAARRKSRSRSRSVSDETRGRANVSRHSRSISADRHSRRPDARRRSRSATRTNKHNDTAHRSRDARRSLSRSASQDSERKPADRRNRDIRSASRDRVESTSTRRKRSASRSVSANRDTKPSHRKRSLSRSASSIDSSTPKKRRASKISSKKTKRHKTSRRSRRSRRRSPSSSASSSASSASSSEPEEDERTKRKQRRRAEKVLATFGYTNETNPFGDANLSQPFVWDKKYETDGTGATKKSSKPTAKELKQQQLARMDEIQKARKRRDEREAEREEMERLKNEELRLRDAEQYDDWQSKEEQFHLHQARVRSTLRIKERREQPIDLLAKNLLLAAQVSGHDDKDLELVKSNRDENEGFGSSVRVERRRPHAIVEVLSMAELEDLRDNIPTYLELEGPDGEHREFWILMQLICNDRIQRLRRSQSDNTGNTGNDRSAIHAAVNDTITEMLRGKDAAALRTLKHEVSDTIASAATTSGVDVEFWEDVTHQIDVYLARLRLNELHDALLETLRELIERYEQKPSKAAAVVGTQTTSDGRDASDAALQMERSEAHKELDEMEEKMDASEEVALAPSSTRPAWSDKYEPRKPRYFNRVKTGYDWNKYNQTHYDHDNPPPKVVQGYKFNLFYPDLLDRHVAPRFFIEKSSSPDFCIIRFSAGPPYEDVAFKIVNREWEYSRKRGFKSVFERGILHLYFNFKRHRYRR